jgi:hypothetical protein
VEVRETNTSTNANTKNKIKPVKGGKCKGKKDKGGHPKQTPRLDYVGAGQLHHSASPVIFT